MPCQNHIYVTPACILSDSLIKGFLDFLDSHDLSAFGFFCIGIQNLFLLCLA